MKMKSGKKGFFLQNFFSPLKNSTITSCFVPEKESKTSWENSYVLIVY